MSVSRKTIDKDLERLCEIQPFDLEKSKCRFSGGVILTWKNWEEIQKPWQKISKNGGSHQNPQSQQSQMANTTKLRKNNESSGSHQKSHLITNQKNKLINSNSLNNSKPNTPPTVSEERRELVKEFQNKFPRVPISEKAIRSFALKLDAAGKSNQEIIALIDELSGDMLIREMIFGLEGLFYKDYREADRRKLDQWIKEQLQTPYSDCTDWKQQVGFVHEQLVAILQKKNTKIQVAICKKEFFAKYKELIDALIQQYAELEVKAEECQAVDDSLDEELADVDSCPLSEFNDQPAPQTEPPKHCESHEAANSLTEQEIEPASDDTSNEAIPVSDMKLENAKPDTEFGLKQEKIDRIIEKSRGEQQLKNVLLSHISKDLISAFYKKYEEQIREKAEKANLKHYQQAKAMGLSIYDKGVRLPFPSYGLAGLNDSGKKVA